MKTITTPIINQALTTVTLAHKDQYRKGEEKIPYVTHLVAVAEILAKYTYDESIICAGLLHDTIEDTSVTYEQIESQFGSKIATIVRDVSEDTSNKEGNEKGSWRERKEGYINHLKVATQEALMVCAADKIHNLRSMIEGYQRDGKAFFEAFNSPAETKLAFYHNILRIIRQRLDNAIVDELSYIYLEAERILSKAEDEIDLKVKEIKHYYYQDIAKVSAIYPTLSLQGQHLIDSFNYDQVMEAHQHGTELTQRQTLRMRELAQRLNLPSPV